MDPELLIDDSEFQTPIYLSVEKFEEIRKFEETQHPRDQKGRFTDQASVTVGDRSITVVKPERATRAGDKLVPVSVTAFDEGFLREAGFYIGVGGEGGIGTRYQRFGEYLSTHDSIDAPEVFVHNTGKVGFINGRHRYAWLRDQGITSIPVAMSPESVANAKKHGMLAAVKKAWDESQHPRDAEGQFTSTYAPRHDDPVEGAWERPPNPHPEALIGPEPIWRQQHRQLIANALSSWVGDPGNLSLHLQDALEGAPKPSSGSGKEMRAQAEALLWELDHNTITNPVTLYRGSGMKGDRRGDMYSWSEDRQTAKVFAKRYGGKVDILPAGTARGLRLRDYTSDAFGEKQWVMRAGNDPVVKWDEAQHPRDDEGQFTTFYHGTVQEQIDSIKAHGLQTSRSGLAWPGLSQPNTIYLGRTKEAAMMWAEATAFKLEWKFDNPTAVVLEVRVPAEVVAKSQRTAEPEGNLRVFQDIPPEWIVGVTVGRTHDAISGLPDRPPRKPPSPVVFPPMIYKQEDETFYVGLVIDGGHVEKWDESQPRDRQGRWVKGSGEPPAVGPRIGLVGPDGKEHVARPTGGGLGYEEDHTDLARRLLKDPEEGSPFDDAQEETGALRKALKEGYVRYWVRRGELALNFRDGNAQTARHALKFLEDNFQHGDRIYLDIEGPTGVLLGKFFDNLREANATVRRAGGMEAAKVAFDEPKYSYGNTQIAIAPTSSAASTLNASRDRIRDDDCMGTGKDVDPNHLTVRYGLLNEDLDRLRSFIARQTPFEARVIGIELFPASEHSEGAVPVVARIASPELRDIEKEIGNYADFKEKSFPVYKPHCTLAYCKPEAAEKYQDLYVDGSFVVQSITISHSSGVQETIPFGMAQKWDESQHPRDGEGKFVVLYHGTREQDVEAIRREGLRQSKEGLVWATESREDAQRFAEGLNYPDPTPDATVIEIHAPKSAFFFEKPLTPGKKDPPGTRVARFARPVPPEWIVKYDPAQPRDERGRFTDLGLHDGQVTVLHGTTRQNAEAILAGGFKPGNPVAVAAQMEQEYGLPKDSILNHVAFQFARGRRDLDRAHFTTDESVADQYSVPEVVQDALTSAHMLLHPTPEDEPFTKEKHAERKAWIDQEAKRLVEPALLAVTVPFAVVGQHGFGKQFTLETFKELLTKFPKAHEDIFNNITIPTTALAGARIQRRKWDESKHPRAPGGSSQGGEFTDSLYGPRDALESLLNEEKDVSIDRGDVRRFLELARKQHEDPDLTDLQVEGMEIFGGNGLGIERDEMPQIPPEHRQRFLKYAEKHGAKITAETVDPLTLKPTQNAISARRVGEKLRKYERGDRKFPSVLVSKEGRILDGHHHWGMMAAFRLEIPDAKMPVFRLQVGVKMALSLMHAYMKIHRLKRATLAGTTVKWDEAQHPRDKEGQFIEEGASDSLAEPQYPSGVDAKLVAKRLNLLKKILPVTDDPRQTSFLLPDGTRLRAVDLLGRNQPHETVIGQRGFSMTGVMGVLGVARYVPHVGVEIGKPLTAIQAQTIADDWIEYNTSVVIEAVDTWTSDRAILASKEFHEPSARVLREFSQHVFRGARQGYSKMAQKADETGRYVTPFVSFDRQGDDQLRMIASLNSSRLATWGFTAEAEVRGMARYRISAVLDGRTSEFCRLIDGKVFQVEDAREKVIEVLNVQDPEDLRVVQPWPKQTRKALAEFEEMTPEELTERGLHIPPYHPYCRTICRIIAGSEGEEMEITPTLPEETEVFQPVTAEDLAELGIDASPEQVAQWNEHIGMSPVELLSKLSGVPPQEVMTKGQGVGSNPIQFDESGQIGIRASGETPSGVEFKLGAILDPFTSTYYLTQADLLKGSPKAELAFVKNLFSELINAGLKSSATSVAVGVTGNAAYYAKLGFLPDELEWDRLRTYTLTDMKTGSLRPVLESLAPLDRVLVEQLLQDGSPSALSALVELPFLYEGRTIGEWILSEIGGIWELDLMDDAVVAQAKAYLS